MTAVPTIVFHALKMITRELCFSPAGAIQQQRLERRRLTRSREGVVNDEEVLVNDVLGWLEEGGALVAEMLVARAECRVVLVPIVVSVAGGGREHGCAGARGIERRGRVIGFSD